MIIALAWLMFAPVVLTAGICKWYPGGTPVACGHNTPLLWTMIEGVAVVAFVAWVAAKR
jgi:hypothetical protein